MIAIEQQPIRTIERNLIAALQCPAEPSALAGALVADHIRACLHGMTAGSAKAVHTTRLLSNARRALHLTWPQVVHGAGLRHGSQEFCADILDRIAQLGDAWPAGKGQWIATPLHLVVPQGSNRCLVVGSEPLPLAKRRLRTDISCSGPARFADASRVSDQSLGQSVDAWLGVSPPLAAWTTTVLSTASASMQNVGGLAADQLEIYAPDVLRGLRRPNRWISARDVSHPLPEARLCRPTLRYAAVYNRPYYLAQFGFSHGSLTLDRQASIPYEITLRLRFGIDARLDAPRKLAIALGHDTFVVDRPLRLPEPEARVLSLGWHDPFAPSEQLMFHRDALPIVLQALSRLSITPDIVRRPVA